MTKTHVARLTVLIAYLEQPKYPKQFVFNQFRLDNSDVWTGESCGTGGCALGDCPTLFKDDWNFVHGVPVLKKEFGAWPVMDDAYISAEKFFGMTHEEAKTLFCPGSYAAIGKALDVNGVKISQLPLVSTRFDVAKNLKRYLRAKKGVVLK